MLLDCTRSFHRLWVSSCHCYSKNCETYRDYNEPKWQYIVTVSDQLKRNTKAICIEKLEDDIDIDQKSSMWSFINRRKQRKQLCATLQKSRIYSDRKDILKMWHEHFQTPIMTGKHHCIKYLSTLESAFNYRLLRFFVKG